MDFYFAHISNRQLVNQYQQLLLHDTVMRIIATAKIKHTCLVSQRLSGIKQSKITQWGALGHIAAYEVKLA
jgi:hypothetical protein